MATPLIRNKEHAWKRSMAEELSLVRIEVKDVSDRLENIERLLESGKHISSLENDRQQVELAENREIISSLQKTIEELLLSRAEEAKQHTQEIDQLQQELREKDQLIRHLRLDMEKMQKRQSATDMELMHVKDENSHLKEEMRQKMAEVNRRMDILYSQISTITHAQESHQPASMTFPKVPDDSSHNTTPKTIRESPTHHPKSHDQMDHFYHQAKEQQQPQQHDHQKRRRGSLPTHHKINYSDN